MTTLYTIGYEGAAQQAILQTLVYHDVRTLLDIRELPLSRKPGFSKKTLALSAADYGLKYEHIPALGTPRDIRYQRKIDHDQAAFRDAYLKHLATQDAAMLSLVSRICEERCCLMCFEADARICHRWFVAERAMEMSEGMIEAVHLSVM